MRRAESRACLNAEAETKTPRDSRSSRVPWADGGAGNRTLVRVSIQNRVYVCRLDFLPSLGSGVEPTSPSQAPEISPSASERRRPASPDLRFERRRPGRAPSAEGA